jgi:DNA polymerase bacteriophage-type
VKRPFHTLLTLDFETAWSRKDRYSLSCMTTEEFIRDPRFKAWGVCINEYGTGKPTQWYGHDELPRIFRSYDWSKTAVLAQNTVFDAGILSWHYDVHPVMLFDTLSMARAMRGVEAGNSLAKLAKALGLPEKGHAVESSDGYLDELPEHVLADLIPYCHHDVWLCEQVFNHFIGGFPAKELRLIDMTMKMFTEPSLLLDADMLVEAIEDEREMREALLKRLNVTDAMLASNDQFAEILRSLSINPPTKKKRPTKKTPHPVGELFAFAKTDAMFQAMLEGDNEDVAALCAARLKVKSTTERTRALRFHDISQRGPLPVPLSYYGAGTGRWTALKGEAINMQNLKRGSFLRKAIMAPAGHLLVVGDLSQIEPRVLAWLSDYEEMLEIFRQGGDPYASFGAPMFSIRGMTKESHPVQRQSAKSALLGCGYQLGWASFAQQLLVGFLGAPPKRYTKKDAKQLGVNMLHVKRFLENKDYVEKMLEIPHICTMDELVIHCVTTKAIVDKYRAAAQPVVEFWSLLGELIEHSLYEGNEYQHKCLTFRKEEIELPNGMKLCYPGLHREAELDDEGVPTKRLQWVYGENRAKLYPGKVCNNVTQGLARLPMTDGMLRVHKRYPVKGTVHDELIAVVPKDDIAVALPWVLDQMTKTPSYMPGIPLAADGGIHRRYGLAKN